MPGLQNMKSGPWPLQPDNNGRENRNTRSTKGARKALLMPFVLLVFLSPSYSFALRSNIAARAGARIRRQRDWSFRRLVQKLGRKFQPASRLLQPEYETRNRSSHRTGQSYR